MPRLTYANPKQSWATINSTNIKAILQRRQLWVNEIRTSIVILVPKGAPPQATDSQKSFKHRTHPVQAQIGDLDSIQGPRQQFQFMGSHFFTSLLNLFYPTHPVTLLIKQTNSTLLRDYLAFPSPLDYLIFECSLRK